MNRISLDTSWTFRKGLPQFVIRDEFLTGIEVSLPHDFQIEQETTPSAVGSYSTGYYEGSAGIYSKRLFFGEELRDKKLILEFDGCYQNTEVRLNGQTVAYHYHGYTPFCVDLSEFARFGWENRLMVIVDNTCQPNSRWYSGAGIYRHVDLRVSDSIYIKPWGIYAYTKHILNGVAFVQTEVEVHNSTHSGRDVWVDIAITSECDRSSGTGRVKVSIPACGMAIARTLIPIREARLWDMDNPALYRITAMASDGNRVLDKDDSLFGIRTITVDSLNGFVLNGQPIKLKGGGLHHDNGILGSASYYSAEYRKIRILKEHGYNSIRTAHNPPSRDLLEVCDRLGMLVLEEALDCWQNGKRLHDYARWFRHCWEEDMEAFMKRDRNHPSIVMWSIGNELVERGGLSRGFVLAEKLAEKARSLDSTRPVICAINELLTGLNDEETAGLHQAEIEDPKHGREAFMDRIWTEKTEAFASPLDVVGYNYLDRRYAADCERWPNRVICGTESYPVRFDEIWSGVLEHTNIIGDFTWTCYDYIGEAGLGKSVFLQAKPEDPSLNIAHDSAYPWRLATCSDFDICGFPRPQLAFRRIVWGSDETFIGIQAPEHFNEFELLSPWGFHNMSDCWTWPEAEGKNIHIVVMSRSEEVRLMINDRLIDSAPCGEMHHFRTAFDTVYEPGKIVAVSVNNGKEISRSTIYTVGAPTRIALIPESTLLDSCVKDIDFLTVEIQDHEGNRVPGIAVPLSVQVEGVGNLAGFGSANPVTQDNYTSGACVSYNGRAQLVIRLNGQLGQVLVRVISPYGESELIRNVDSLDKPINSLKIG